MCVFVSVCVCVCVCVCVRACARACVRTDGYVGDWSCHQSAVEMTVDYWAAAT